jgi:hypothetical protein
MDLSNTLYVPILKWRQGEYQALSRLAPATKSVVTPLVEVPPIEWDFEKGKLSKTLDEHLAPLVKRLATKWGKAPALVDFNLLGPNQLLTSGTHAIDAVFAAAASEGVNLIPVTGLGRALNHHTAVARATKAAGGNLCVRVTLDQLGAPSTESGLLEIIEKICGTDVDHCVLVVDLGAPNFHPVAAFAKAIAARVRGFTFLDKLSLVAVGGTAFPESMTAIKMGANIVPRSEWAFFTELRSQKSLSGIRLAFVDYGIAHPVLPAGDMRLLKPSATVRYTARDSWIIVKGDNVRDNGFEQYEALCGEVTKSPEYTGPTYSAGDCSKGLASTGNLSVWRWVGTNHHITRIARDLASLSAP